MTEPGIDTTLLRGARFLCRPDCGLCCYARAAVSPAERTALIQLRPELPLAVEADGFAYLPVRGDGGACVFLDHARCRAYDRRPFPCRTYPIVTHVGTRAQATVVLSCPGVDLAFLDDWTLERAAALPEPVGLDSELEAARREGPPELLRTLVQEVRRAVDRIARRRARRGDDAPLPKLLADLARAGGPRPMARGAEGTPPPTDAALEELPLFFEAGTGVVAVRSARAGRYELMVLDEAGRAPRRIGEVAPSEDPTLTADARPLLGGYRRYLLARESFVFSTLYELSSGAEGPLRSRLASGLDRILAEVLRRATVRRLVRGEPGDRIDRTALEEGIRATDAEVLDRPTIGRVL